MFVYSYPGDHLCRSVFKDVVIMLGDNLVALFIGLMHVDCSATNGVASHPGVPIWSRGEEERLVHIVLCMRLISEKSLKIGYPGSFPCNGDVTFVDFLQPQYSLV